MGVGTKIPGPAKSAGPGMTTVWVWRETGNDVLVAGALTAGALLRSFGRRFLLYWL